MSYLYSKNCQIFMGKMWLKNYKIEKFEKDTENFISNNKLKYLRII